jgi:hypothetical protein
VSGFDAGPIIEWERVLQARADAGDKRAAEALERHPLRSNAWLEERQREARSWPSISAWVGTWGLDEAHQRQDDESVEAWVMRQLRAMGADGAYVMAWMAFVTGRNDTDPLVERLGVL